MPVFKRAWNIPDESTDSEEGDASPLINALRCRRWVRENVNPEDIDEETESLVAEEFWTQDELDLVALKLFLNGKQPLKNITERIFGETWMKGFGQKSWGLEWPSLEKLERLIVRKDEQLKAELEDIIECEKVFATTVEAWSNSDGAILGITVHWFDDELQRKSACLGLKRFVGEESHKKLLKSLSGLCKLYGLDGKLGLTTTNNGPNFCSLFEVFGDKFFEDGVKAKQPSPGGPAYADFTPSFEDEMFVKSLEDGDTSESDSEEENRGRSDDLDTLGPGVKALLRGFRPVNRTGALSNDPASLDDGSNPPYFHCAAHRLNLVATMDAARAREDKKYSETFDGVTKKLKALWNCQPKWASTVTKKNIWRLFKADVKTRWNSTYNALRHIAGMSKDEREILEELYDGDLKLAVEPITDEEYLFIKEYVQVMQPLAMAFDVLRGQGALNGQDPLLGMGYLVPIIGSLLCRYERKLASGLAFCKKLVEVILTGLNNRFKDDLGKDELRLAAAVHPKFRLRGLDFLGVAEKDLITRLVKERVAQLLAKKADAEASSSPEVHDAGLEVPPKKQKLDPVEVLLGLLDEPEPTNEEKQAFLNMKIDVFLNATPQADENCFVGLEPMKELFIETNIGMPSSAPAQRLFAAAGSVFHSNGRHLKDGLLESIVFLCANSDVLGL